MTSFPNLDGPHVVNIRSALPVVSLLVQLSREEPGYKEQQLGQQISKSVRRQVWQRHGTYLAG
ncbi:hypothetical protein [Pseudarthrobacter sp. NPDC080039]|uniref:hypothetical protein n=1 Tax=unclassified Pseudarthrobacter TaxID=2647000 RepID=UPI00344FE3B8